MSQLNIIKARNLLKEFKLSELFINELQWNNPAPADRFETQKDIKIANKTIAYKVLAIAALGGAKVFTIWPVSEDDKNFTAKEREAITDDLYKTSAENLAIFLDKKENPDASVWIWRKKQDKRLVRREHWYIRGQTGDLFVNKIRSLFFDISENDVKVTEVASALKKALDIEAVTKRFYTGYQEKFEEFSGLIEGFEKEDEKRWYASVLLNRLMFIYFLQQKGFVNNDRSYLTTKLLECQKKIGPNRYYNYFLQCLFFEGFARPEADRSPETNILLGNIKYLNGGLFIPHKFEDKAKYPNVAIPDKAFELLISEDEPKGLFNRYTWSLNDLPGQPDTEINPDVLGYIFEKYINQKEFGAYYTRPEITEYLCQQTVNKLILDKVNDSENTSLVPALKGKVRHYESVEEMVARMDDAVMAQLVLGDNAILKNLTLLDPACGSGAFLVSAMKVLINLYGPIYGKIKFSSNPKLKGYFAQIEKDHPSVDYYIKKQIITNNLYGVDIMEEATEIARLRLFLALVSAAQTVDELEPLPNIDFNIMCGNSLIGLVNVDTKAFDAGHQLSLLPNKTYAQIINEKEAAINAYRHIEGDGKTLGSVRASIEEVLEDSRKTLNNILRDNFGDLGIKYQQQTWDAAKKKLGKPKAEPLKKEHIIALQPFHWAFEFSEIMRKGGFDAIITNPPWEIVKPQAKEFFAKYSKLVTKNKMSIKDFEKEQEKLMQNAEVRNAWLDYLSSYPHQSEWFRAAKQYKNQSATVNGKKTGSDINLYKLFTEQCYNLLKPGGYCGIVIPSGIYTDLGAKGLRQLLLEHSKITGLFCFENRKAIFENVDSRFKFVVLSFSKAGCTTSFPAAFMRHDADELERFPKYGSMNITHDFIKRQSPDSLSIMELKSPLELQIAEKMLKFPKLGGAEWGVKLTTEFHMTNDSYLFKTENGPGRLPLFEGKMIHQFTHQWGPGKYWIDETEGRKAILGRTVDTGQKLGYQQYRLAHRAIASSTNERTFICSIIPKGVFYGHSMNSTTINQLDKLLLLTSNLNSFCFDFYLRNTVSANLTMQFINQTPVLVDFEGYKRYVINNAARLICTTLEYAELWEEVMGSKWSPEVAAHNPTERNRLRAELDGIIAHLYGLTDEEFLYILSTFPIVPEAQRQATYNAYRDVRTGVIKI